MRLPSLSVLILYGISNAVSPACISQFDVISDHFLFKYNDLILTISMSSPWESGPGVWPHVYFHFMHCTASFAPAYLPKVSHLAACSTHFPICWALSGCMTSPTVPAWLSLVCCNIYFSSPGIFLLWFLFYSIKCLSLHFDSFFPW